MKSKIVISTASLLVASVAAAVAWNATTDMRIKPSREAMYSHRVSMLSDAEIMSLRAQSKAAAEKHNEDAKETLRRIAHEQFTLCADEVYRARNKSTCESPVLAATAHEEAISVGADRVFEQAVLGACVFSGSIYDARKMGCLPPN